MFCSICRRVSFIQECRRRICPIGHIACDACDDNLEACPLCQMRYSQVLCVSSLNHIPRLYMMNIPHQQLENEEDDDSIQEIINGLKNYETHGKNQKNEDGNHTPVFGCFQVMEKKSSHDKVQSTSNYSEEERDIMRHFRIIDQPTLENIPETPKCHQKFADCQVQTTSREFSSRSVPKTVINPPVTPRPSETSLISSKNFYPNENPRSTQSLVTSDSASIYEMFRGEMAEDSDTAHFTTLTVSTTNFSPPKSPKRKASSPAHRVKFVSFFHVDGVIPAQMEPLVVYDTEDAGADSHLPSDRARKLPRFPVRCPITNCDSFSVPSDFCNHITIDHPFIDVLKVEPQKLINLSINHKGNANIVTCQRLFLVKNKITDIGYGSFENCLPVVLLTSKISLSKTFACTNINNRFLDEKFCIWCVGTYQFPLSYTITLWTHGRDDYEPTMITLQSTSINYMSRPFNPREVVSNALAISQLELSRLTDGNRKMLSCQIVFH